MSYRKDTKKDKKLIEYLYNKIDDITENPHIVKSMSENKNIPENKLRQDRIQDILKVIRDLQEEVEFLTKDNG